MKWGLCGPCGTGPNPTGMAFFLLVKSQRQIGMQPQVSGALPGVSLVRHHSVRVIYAVWSLLLNLGKASPEPGRWCRYFGEWWGRVQSSPSTSSRLQTGVFSKAREDERGSRVVVFGSGRCSVKYGTTHTNSNAQKTELSQSTNCWQNDAAWHSQGPRAGCTTVIPTQPSCVISQCNLSCQ